MIDFWMCHRVQDYFFYIYPVAFEQLINLFPLEVGHDLPPFLQSAWGLPWFGGGHGMGPTARRMNECLLSLCLE